MHVILDPDGLWGTSLRESASDKKVYTDAAVLLGQVNDQAKRRRSYHLEK
jgi:hypothetical protein